MIKIAAVYTGQGLSGPLQELFHRKIPQVSLVNLIDDGIIREVNRVGKMTPDIAMRLLQYFHIAQEMGADYILNTCSSVGEVVAPARQFIRRPIIRIDEAMAATAVKKFKRIGVIATLPTTQAPTMRLLKEKAAQQSKTVTIVSGLAQDAYHALVSGNPQLHDEYIEKAAERIAPQVDGLVLAQGSMMRMQEKLSRAIGKPVLSSPVCCVQYLKDLLDGQTSDKMSQ